MLIDWFTVGAQAVNFLILVWLLQRFLYKPVLAAVDAREKKVAAQIADAAALDTKAQAERADLHRRSEAFDREREDLLHKATEEANAERQRLLESARQESQQMHSKLTQALAQERAELGHQLSVRTQAEVFAVARKTLADLAGASLEDRMIEVFIAHLRELPRAQRLTLAGGDANIGGVVVTDTPGTHNHADPTQVALVRSAFVLPAAGRASIEAAVHECLGATVTTHFETSPEFVCGVELSMGGVRIAWSVADYLFSLSQSVATLVEPEPAAPTLEAQHGH
jgi:F-type H+-transporting ATPase subunit b